VESNRRLVQTEAKIALKDGTIIAEGTATMFVVRPKEEPRQNVKS
jgi:hypothetical protein